jgi:hypothetical protein
MTSRFCKFSGWCVFTFCLMLLAATGSRAQEARGSLSGTVTDPTGAAIPAAKVTARNSATNASLTVGSSTTGDYTILDLDPGLYTVTVEANGFKTLVRNNIEVREGVRLGLDLPLEVGNASQTVTVTAETPLLITDSGSGGQVLNSDLVGSVPLLGSNVLSLINTTSGNSHVSAFPDHLSERPFDNGGMDGYAINGAPAGGNNNSYLIDGAPNNNNEGAGFVPPPDAVSQVNVMTNEYDSEFGKTGGAITSVALKTGTNKFHGVAYWNVRNNHLNANLWQNNHVGKPSQVTQLSEPGFQIGGPVLLPHYNGRDKTFFSVSFEHYFDTVPSSVSRTYPSASQLMGNFCSGAAGNNGIGTVIYDPTTNPRTAFGGCPAGQTGSIVPASRIDPTMLALLGHLPGANVAGCSNPRTTGCNTNFLLPQGHGDNYHALTIRFDHNLSSTEKLFASYEDGNRLEFIDNPGQLSAADAGLFPLSNTWRINHGATANLTSIISPTLINTAKINWLRHDGLGRSAAHGAMPTSLGLSSQLQTLFGNNNFPGIGFSGSTVNYTGFSQGGTNATTLGDNWTAQDSITKVAGAHSLKGGALVTITTQNNKAASLIPTITFGDVFSRDNFQSSDSTGDAIASALMGYPSSISYTNPFRASYETRYFALFAQDDWRVTKKLTLNLGLRWDTQSAPHERYNRAVIGFNPAAVSIGGAVNALASNCTGAGANAQTCPTNGLGGTYTGGLVYATGDNRSPWANDYQNWAPRLGIAYQITNKLVFRGGWGRFYDYALAYTFPGSTGFTSTSTVTVSPSGTNQFPTLCAQTTGCTIPNSSAGSANNLAGLSANGFASIFPNGLVPITGNTLGAKTGAGTSISYIDPTYKPAYVNQFNAGLDYQLPSRMVFHIEYNGSRSHNVPLGNSKTWDSVTAQQYLGLNNALNATVANPFAGLLPGTTLNGATTTEQQLLLPYPQFTGVTESSISIGRLWYNSLQTRLEKRVTHGLTVIGNFTWSKNIGATTLLNPNFDTLSLTNVQPSSPFSVCNSCGVVREPVNIDQPFLFNIVMSYQIPLFNSSEHRFVKAALGGWTLTGTGQWQSGSLLASPTGNLTWTGVDPTKVINGVWTGQTTSRWFNNCVLNSTGTALLASSVTAGCPAGSPLADAPWQQTANGFFLNNKPPYFEHNRTRRPPVASLALFKSFAITERMKFEIRADAYNLTNTPWFGFGDNGAGITTTATSTSFGAINPDQGNDPRIVQLAGRFSF